jgi:hypothetical protein
MKKVLSLAASCCEYFLDFYKYQIEYNIIENKVLGDQVARVMGPLQVSGEKI